MIDIVVIITCVTIVLALLVTMTYEARADDWLEQIYERQGKIIVQNARLQRQLETAIKADLDGLEFIEMSHPRGDNNDSTN